MYRNDGNRCDDPRRTALNLATFLALGLGVSCDDSTDTTTG
jgi:hypothetical protein